MNVVQIPPPLRHFLTHVNNHKRYSKIYTYAIPDYIDSDICCTGSTRLLLHENRHKISNLY